MISMNKEKRSDIFRRIYDEYKDSVFRTCYMILNDYYLAEDAAQETFFKVYCKLNTFKGKSSIKTWITKISINICKDKLKNKINKEIPYEDFASCTASPKENEIDNKLVIVRVITDLPIELREVIVLYYYQELKQNEIAKILKIPLTTVAYRLKKAKETLKSNIKEDIVYE